MTNTEDTYPWGTAGHWLNWQEFFSFAHSRAYACGEALGAENERKLIIKALQNSKIAEALIFNAQNTSEENPHLVRFHAWERIEQLLREEQDD
jgi:hypothetical protein